MKANILFWVTLTLSSHVFAGGFDRFLGTYVVTEQTCLLNGKIDYGCPPLAKVKVVIEGNVPTLYEVGVDGTSLKRTLTNSTGDANSASSSTPQEAVSFVRLVHGGVSYVSYTRSEESKIGWLGYSMVSTRGYTLYPTP